MRHRVKVVTRFRRLRAASLVLRGHSVAYRLNFSGDAEGVEPCKSASWFECQVRGEPVTVEHIWLADAGEQDMS